MKWIKKGQFYAPESNHDWMVSHAQMPVVDLIDEDVARVYFGTRSQANHTVTTYIEVSASNPKEVLYIHDRPVLGRGKLGCFDDGGAMPSWIVNRGDIKYFYYVGWNAGVTVGYRNSIGIAISEDGGKTFERMFDGPIVDRNKDEPQFCSTPCVLVENDKWRMWYLNGVRWEIINGHPEPLCHIKYAESKDGINWDRNGVVAIDLKPNGEGGMSKPHVIKEDGKYKMWYCYRGDRDYRENSEHAYRIGYAESPNGITWERMDDRAGIGVSKSGWDSIMIAFPYVYQHKGIKYMLFNGNGFGQTGIGYAVEEV